MSNRGIADVSRIAWWRTGFGDEEVASVADAIRHERVGQGVVTAEFERRLGDVLGVPYVVATTSGSMALLMALLAARVGPGDEVIMPNRAWIAGAHAVLLLGAKVVLADVLPHDASIDSEDVERRITSRTKVLMPVHLNGRSSDMVRLNAIARRHNLLVIEDAAQAFCSKNALGYLGCQSLAGCFSLSPAKVISTGQGGFVVTRDEEIHRRLVLMRSHGVADVVNAQWTGLGFNFRFNDVLASIGLVQLDRLQDRIDQVRAVHEEYRVGLRDLPSATVMPVDVHAGELPIYVELLTPKRESLMAFLAAQGIQTRPFYPDLNVAPYLNNPGRYPRSEVFARQGLFLPSGPSQPLENVRRVIEAVRTFLAQP